MKTYVKHKFALTLLICALVSEVSQLSLTYMTSRQRRTTVLSTSYVVVSKNESSSQNATQTHMSEQQERIHREISDYLSSSYVSLPPHTPGAWLHIGKTGGSTLSHIHRNACHSYVRKPCKSDIKNESIISRTTTYIHVPDFPLLPNPASNYSFYVIGTRDPYDRILSIFTFQHPKNPFHKRRDRFKIDKKLFSCFQTLENFTHFLGDHPKDYVYVPSTIKRRHGINSDNCTALARAMMDQHLPSSCHFFWGYKKVLEPLTTKSNRPVLLVVRTENLWDDWKTANQWLGQDGEVATFHDDSARSYNILDYNVTKDVSDEGRYRLCLALLDDYVIYLKLIHEAVNLSPLEKTDMLELARLNCPNLALNFTGESFFVANGEPSTMLLQ